MQIIVTGGSGFIGRSLVKLLLSEGYTVKSIDDLSRGVVQNIIDPKFVQINCSVLDYENLKHQFRGFDAVIHLAAINGTSNFYLKPYDVFDVSVSGTLNVIRACEFNTIDTLIYSSSAEVYGEPTQIPTPETYVPNVDLSYRPRFSYGGGKLVGELLMNYLASHNLKRSIIFRPHNVYGPQMGFEHVIPQVIEKIFTLKNSKEKVNSIEIQGTGSETRAFAFVEDVVKGIKILLENGENGKTYHIGTSVETSIKELIFTISKLMKYEVNIINTKLLQDSPMHRLPDISRISKLGYTNNFSLLQGLEKTIEWYSHYFSSR